MHATVIYIVKLLNIKDTFYDIGFMTLVISKGVPAEVVAKGKKFIIIDIIAFIEERLTLRPVFETFRRLAFYPSTTKLN